MLKWTVLTYILFIETLTTSNNHYTQHFLQWFLQQNPALKFAVVIYMYRLNEYCQIELVSFCKTNSIVTKNTNVVIDPSGSFKSCITLNFKPQSCFYKQKLGQSNCIIGFGGILNFIFPNGTKITNSDEVFPFLQSFLYNFSRYC